MIYYGAKWRVFRSVNEGCNEVTVYQLCAKFLTFKLNQRNNGELAEHTFKEYGAVCKRLNKVLGRGRLVSDLRPDDFAKLRAAMAKKWLTQPRFIRCFVRW